MKKIAHKRRRFGYRRIGVMLEREGYVMNHKKLYRLYTEEKARRQATKGQKTRPWITDTYARGLKPRRALVFRLSV